MLTAGFDCSTDLPVREMPCHDLLSGQGYLTVTGTVFMPQGDLKFTAKVPARLLTEMTEYLTGPPVLPRDSGKTTMSFQFFVVAVTWEGPFTF